MGVVYRASQRELDREVAVKMIRSGILADEAEVRRFYTEAQAAARLHHPGIVAVHQFGIRAGHHFFSMEYIPGTDLQRRINESELDPLDAARYVRDVARAIHHAHQKGVLHRDLKPANVLIDEQDQIHVTDFGLAKHMDSDSSVTGSGAAVGTPHYMAPEQAGGHSDHASRQSDVYSLGAVLFACLTGRPPIVADTVMQTLVQVVHHPAPSVRSLRPEVPLDLETIIAKCLEKNPQKRYATAEKLAQELDAFLEGRPIEARPRSRVVKAWHWIEGVPLVGALSGRRVLHSSDLHRRFQAAMLCLMLVTPLIAAALLLAWQQYKQAMPSEVRFAGGIPDGIYSQVSQELGQRVQALHQVPFRVVGSGGSHDNRDLLLSGQVDIAPMQVTAITGQRLFLVAPLFHELLYVLARPESGIETLEDLRGRTVAVGPRGSGSRETSELIFASLNFGDDIRRQVIQWPELFADDAPEAAMVCIGRDSPLMSQLVGGGRWKLIPIPDAVQISLQHPSLDAMTIDHREFPGVAVAEQIPTVGTTAFLVATDDTPASLVTAVLQAIYQEPPPFKGLISRSQLTEWPSVAFHPAARQFFGLDIE
jgi:TRAP transporter TAXI family solute receptor